MARMTRFSLLLLLFAGPALGQERRDPPPGSSFPVQQRLKTADALIEPVLHAQDLAVLLSGFNGSSLPLGPFASLALAKADNYEQAYDEYRRILRSTPEAMVPTRPLYSSEQSTAVVFRHVFHHRMSRMPPSVLQRYRDEVDADAKALWETAEAERSTEPLLRIAEEFFASRHGDLALDRLGDAAFQAGRFEEAQSWWRRVAAPVDQLPSSYQYPDSRIDPALLRAKQILAEIFQGKLDAADRQLELFRRQHHDAQGALAGTKGTLATILGDQVRLREKHLANDFELSWPTFAGNAHRNRVLATPPSPSVWRDGPLWRTKIPASKDLLPIGTPRRPPLHPCIADDHVYVTDGRFIAGYELYTGKEAFRYPPQAAEKADSPATGGWSRPSVTVRDGRIFAVLRPESRMQKGEASLVNTLIALDPTGKVQWKVEAKTPDGLSAVFDPTPLAVGSRLYLVMRRSHSGRTKTWVACCDLEGRVRWTQELAETNEPEHDPGRPPLVWAGDRVVHLSNSGWASALHPRTGEPLWSLRYGDGKPRDGKPSPEGAALYAEGCVVFAPADQPRVFAVDAVEGRVLWSLPLEATDLAGASNGRVFAVTKLGLESIDLRSGESRRRWRQPAEGRLPTLGRGLLAGGWIFWPTADPLLPWRTLTQAEGLPQKPLADSPLREPNYFDPAALFRVPAGETAFGQGCMAIATADELVVYVANRRLAPKLLPEARDDRPETLYRLADAYRREGRFTEADIFLARLLANVPSAERGDWQSLWNRDETPRKPLTSQGRWHYPMGNSKTAERIGGVPLEKSWSRWEGGRLIPTDNASSRHFFVQEKKRVVACRLETGEALWAFDATMSYTWIEATDNRTVFAGPLGIEARQTTDGRHLWSFANPTSTGWRLQEGRPSPPSCTETLNGFLLLNDRLTCRLGARCLIQLNEDNGSFACISRPRSVDTPTLHDHIFLPPMPRALRPENYVVNDRDGPESHRLAELWPDSVKNKLAEETYAIGLPQGQVEYRHESGVIRWNFRPDAPHSLTGEPARVFALGESFLVLVPRNLGDEWIRLDAKTGEIIWKLEPGVFPEPLDLDAMILDRSNWYVCMKDMLEARSLRTGQKAWRTALPKGFAGWRPIQTKHGILVVPIAKPPKPELCGPPDPEPRIKDAPSEAPILLFSAADGQAMHRIAVPYRGGPIDVQVGAQWLLVSTGRTLHAYRCGNDVAKR